MKKPILFFALIFVAASFFSQNWCPPGAKWHIKRGGFIGDFGAVDGVITMSGTKDTAVIGIPCKRLDAFFKGKHLWGPVTGFDVTFRYKTFFTYSNNNVIFLYNAINAFDTVVNFNALPGDKWLKLRSTDYGCLKRQVVTVTDTGHITINGFYLKQIKTVDTAAVVGTSWTPQNTYTYTYKYPEVETYVERILFSGVMEQNLFQTGCEYSPDLSDGPPRNLFRCYEDSVFPLYKEISSYWSSSAKPCDYTTGIETIESNNINLSLYPNPNNGSFQLEIQQATDISIFNMLGERVYSTSFKEPGKNWIEAANIAPGAYLLEAKTAHGSGKMKFIRQ